MTAIDALNTEIAKILSGNDLYNSYRDQWQYLLESYMGGDEYRRAGHLVRYQLESDGEYQQRLFTTPLDNHCAGAISIYNSFLFRNCPERSFGSMENLPEVEDFLDDADFDGRSLDAFMKDVSTWASVFGHCWVIVCKPNVGAVTRADEIAMGVRPYVSVLTPLVVTDWRWERLPSGRFRLVYLKYLEDVTDDIHTVKEWTPETVRTIVVHEADQSISSDITEPNGLGKIPAVCVYAKKSPVKGIGISDIADIADCQRFIYNATSEIDQSIRLDSHPSLVKTPETQAGVGAGSLIHIPDNLDPGLKPYLLQYTGAEIGAILTTIKHQITAIEKMANIGSVRQTETRTMSGVAMQTEFQLLNAKLSEKADALELGEEQIWKLFAEYMGYEWDGEICYPDTFNLRDEDGEIQRLQIAASTNPADPRVKAAIDSKILDWLDLDEDEITAIANPMLMNLENIPELEDEVNYEPKPMIDPVSGEQRMTASPEDERALAKMGWTERDEG